MNERRGELHKQVLLHECNTECRSGMPSWQTDPFKAEPESLKVNVHQENLRQVGAPKSESAELSNLWRHVDLQTNSMLN